MTIIFILFSDSLCEEISDGKKGEIKNGYKAN